MENISQKDNAYLDDFLKENSDDLEGIIQNEPVKNKYETIHYHKMNQFPYYLIGKVVSKFEIDGVYKFLNGVGILIGPSIVLTVAHNLTHLTPKGVLLQTKRVAFFPASNGDFLLFEPVKSIKTFTPEKYLDALKSDKKEDQLLNDWGLIFLSSPIGNSITSLLELQKRPELKVDRDAQLYNFFTNNQTDGLAKIVNSTNSSKISLIGYTEYKDQYKNNSAYKFLSNFKKNKVNDITESTKKDINLNKGQKKLGIEGDGEKEKKISININISEDITEGLITSSRYYHPMVDNSGGEVSLNGLDYIVLGDEDLNKNFDVTDAEKHIMSESKGNLVMSEDENENKAIKYQISTYKGQSGSPIFLRFKKITTQSKNSEYIYKFIGLHSRRGPSVGAAHFYESEKMAALTENLLTVDEPRQMNNQPKTKSNISGKQFELQNKSSTNAKMKTKTIELAENEIVKLNGTCDYNLAVSVFAETITEIIGKINEEFGEFLGENDQIVEPEKSEFVYTKLLLNEEEKFEGLFKRQVAMSVLFGFGAKVLNVPREYILLADNTTPYNLVYNPNFDQNKKLSEIMEDPDHCSSISFELNLNIQKYGEFLANNILNKFLENNDLEEKQLKRDFKAHTKGLFYLIFREINSFESMPLTYGKLFKKIRKMILKKLEMNSEGKN